MGDAPATTEAPIVLLAVGGDPAGPFRVPPIPTGSIVVAADSGLDHLARHDTFAHHLVGDLDSADPALVDAAIAAGTRVHRHEPDKDATDLELALALIARELAPAAGVERLVVVGPGGGRLDLLLGDLLALAGPALRDLEVCAHLGAATAWIVRPGAARSLPGPVGEVLSLLPLHGPAHGVTTSGVRWPLVDADLVAGTTRAISNERLAPEVRVVVREGVLAVVAPGARAALMPVRSTPYDPTPRAPGGAP